ncbi:hypothetical protein ACFL0Q_04645 [Thermodesulfobacteriota bacterium]
MSALREELETVVDNLARKRDELKVQIHLAKAEVRQEWEEAEKKWSTFRAKAGILRDEEPVRQPTPDLVK